MQMTRSRADFLKFTVGKLNQELLMVTYWLCEDKLTLNRNRQ